MKLAPELSTVYVIVIKGGTTNFAMPSKYGITLVNHNNVHETVCGFSRQY